MENRLTKKEATEAARRQPTKVEVERSLEELSRWMDGLFRIPGTDFSIGLDALIGLVPGIGDFATSAVSFYILAAGVRYRVSKVTLLRMALNIAIDYLLGALPVVGDLIDPFWKSNRMNVELLRERATVSAAEARRGRVSDWLFILLLIFCLLAMLVGSVVIAWWVLRFLYRQLY